MKHEKKQRLSRITLSFPEEVLKEIDDVIEKNFLTRTKWFHDAAINKLNKDKQKSIDDVIKGKK